MLISALTLENIGRTVKNFHAGKASIQLDKLGFCSVSVIRSLSIFDFFQQLGPEFLELLQCIFISSSIFN
jgi:hypothetical protein